MPSRNESGSAIMATVAIASPSTIGCQPYRARMPQTRANATPRPIGMAIRTRYQPGALNLAASVTAGYLPGGLGRKPASYLRRTLRFDKGTCRESARRLELSLSRRPGVELRPRDHVRELAHRG